MNDFAIAKLIMVSDFVSDFRCASSRERPGGNEKLSKLHTFRR